MKIAHPARTFFDIAQLLLGAALVASPWFASYLGERYGTYHAWAAGSAVVLIALAMLIAQWRWLPWAIGAVALWTIAAPWALQFEAAMPALWSHVGIGIALLAAAIADLATACATPKTKQAA